ncbi:MULTISPECIES: hypothetical protein [unclassified Rhizobium]|uniref:hypothetical protein n=1 Tax=unclassified Rhizobium TaxID=2613769 RepID=UPI0021585E37|nr:hypothetical protein [Rhizobium sp. TH2]UVC08480.1 hypothetical protein IHQ71_25600 [Rhizobium sp. TH2]
MVEMTFYIWLLGAALIFVAVAMSGQATDRSQAIWLLLLAASWPFVLVFMAVGAVLMAISAAASTKP